MTLAALLLSLVALGDDLPGDPRLDVTRVGDRVDAYVGEPIGVRVALTLDEAFVDEQLVSMFRRPLDLPVHVDAPWWGDPALGTWLDALPPDGGVTLALGDDAVTARRTTDAEGRAVYVVERWLVPDASGLFTLEPTTLRYAYATSFREDLLAGRVPEDRRDVDLPAEGFEYAVIPRPPSPSPTLDVGATGPVSLSVDAPVRDAEVGEAFTLRVVVEGEAPLVGFEVPAALTTLEGLHVLGTLVDAPDPRTRVVTLELERSDRRVTAIPSIAISAFDPTPPAGHRRVSVDAIPLDVAASDDVPATTTDPLADTATVSAPVDASPRWPWALGGLVVGWLLARLAGGPRGVDRSPARDVARAASRAGDDPEAQLLAAIAARLGRAPGAVAGRDVRDDLVASGLAEDAADRASDLAERLVASRYGGSAVPDAAASVATVLASLRAD